MRFGLIHRIMTDSLATLGILALVTSGKLNPVAVVLVLLGLLLGLFLPERHRQQAFLQVTGVVGPLLALAIQIARLAMGADPIPIVVEFAAALQVMRLITRRGAAHDHQVILLSLLHLIAGTVLGSGLTYAVALMGFLVFTPGALVLSHLRREVEGNYRQGARDRTGMPVDVPRILRSRRVIGRGFLLFTCSLSLPVFFLSALLFMAFPRVGFAWLAVPPISPSRVVGFSSRVDLGGVGTIRTDPALVMRVRPSDTAGKEDQAARRNFYLRGAVFDTYDGRSWHRLGVTSNPPSEHGNEVILRRSPRLNDRTLHIDLDRIDPPVVFVPGEAVALKVLSANRHPRGGDSVISADASGQLSYSAMEQSGITYDAYLPPLGLIFPEREPEAHLRRYLVVPPELSERTRALALTLSKGATEPLAIARALETGLRAGYTYDLGSPSGAAKDPLDHFLFESKRGHCEFYSTAMAMLLRVRGVPSRNVTGFVGGTFNRFGGFYAVRQGDAHSWVEAYLPDRGWIRFDPTPPSSAEPQAISQGASALVRDIFEAAAESWRQNVVGFDMQKQVGILRRLERTFSSDKKGGDLNFKAALGSRRVWLGIAGLLVVAAGVVLFVRRNRAPEPGEGPDLSPSMARSIDLYRKLDRTCSLCGVPRPISTPPLAHAKALKEAGHPLGEEVHALTQIYLGARFGGRRLTEEQARSFVERVNALRPLLRKAESATDHAA